MLSTKLRFIWPSGFRGEDYQKSTNQKQESPVVAMFVNGSGPNQQSAQSTFHKCFMLSFGSFGKSVSEKQILRNRPIKNKNCLWRPYLLTDWDQMSKFYRRPSIDASCEVSVHLAERFQRRSFQKSTNQKQELPVAAMFVNGSERNEQSLQRTFHRCFLPSFSSFN